MRRLATGQLMNTPEGVKKFGGGMPLTAADTPAAAQLAGTKESVGPSTVSVCRGCHCLQHSPDESNLYRQPNSFLSGCPGWAAKCSGRKQVFKLRSKDDLLEYASLVMKWERGVISHSALTDWLQKHGINTFQTGFARVPLYNPVTGAPMDAMHVLFEGITRLLLGIVVYYADRHWGVPVKRLVSRIAKYSKKHKLGAGFFPHVNSTRAAYLRTGVKGKKPRSDTAYPGTAIQLKHLAEHAIQILSPLVKKQHKQSPAWMCLVVHVEIVHLLMQRSFTMDDILTLDRKIWLHDSIWLKAPELRRCWKPKNHYLSHFPLDILRWGPPRSYWCTPFEGENQDFKGWAKRRCDSTPCHLPHTPAHAPVWHSRISARLK